MQTINGFRLSPQQKYLWLLQQDSPAYRAQCALLLVGDLKTEALKKALERVSDRHEILRTTFHRRSGIKIPIQVIAEGSIISWESVNYEGLNSSAQVAKIEELLCKEKYSSFNFEQNPIWHLSLISLSINRHILVVSLPSLCADSWTLKNLIREISESYSACLQGQELSDNVVQYVQYSEWQNELIEDEEAAEGKKYWNDQYNSELVNLKLPFENKLIDLQDKFEPNCFEVKIELDLLAKIDQISRRENTSFSTFLLACWKTLLWRLVGKAEIVVATALNGRKYEELEPTFGLFTKFLPIRSYILEHFTFQEILQQIQQSESNAYKLQEYFFPKNLGDDLSFFPFCFEFEEQLEKYSAAGVDFSMYQQYVCNDRFKVKLSCQRRENGIVAEFYYDSTWIGEQAIQCLAEQFYTLVKSAANNPTTAIGELQILSDRTCQEILVEFNSTKADYPQNKCIHQLFEEQAELVPEQIAIVFENQQLTYRQLNLLANQIAYSLQKLGVKSEVIVGICADRSVEAIAGILGILKAGGAYLPLDPAMPKDRLALMLQDARVPVVLTQQHLLESVPQTGAEILCLDTDIPLTFDAYPLLSSPSPENLAYVIYTSGSTGNPKGVAIEHRALVNYLYSIQERLNLPSNASFATVSTLAADLGNTVIFPALCIGGCLHIISQECATNPEAIAAYFQQHSIDCLKIVPSHLKALLTAANPAQVLPKKRLILGGEVLTWNLLATIQKYAPDCLIFNHYGPTETTVGVLTYQIKEQENSFYESVPLGRPINNVQIYLLDPQLQPVPIGVSGELYIGGASLARGYLNQPQLTKEKFIVNPFNLESGLRLYKTGDLARYLPDGNIEFLGRIDAQVKLRGFRIELGEIEAVLSQHPAVSEAVVLLRENEPGNQRLVAYLVPNLDSAIAIKELRSFLKEKLPEYMVPSAFVILKALPLTTNGKIDRRALLASEVIKADLADSFVAPRTRVETILAEIWAELLGLDQVGIYDNFFDLGGHSLLITQLLAKVRDVFQVELLLRRFFEAPTIAALAKNIEVKHGLDAAEDRPVSFDINAEVVLDPAIRPDSLSRELITEPACILLTGSTGFLGAFLLHDLLQQTQAEIYCLVRSPDPESGKKRIQSSLESYSIWDESNSHRILPIIGDLSQPLLGLSEGEFQVLANKIDVIYHNGAFVKFTYPYSVLKPANVLGTQEILRLASQCKVKPVHFISTISIFSAIGESGIKVVREQDELTAGEDLKGAYTQSKWVAEKLMAIARERGIPVNIYRPGRISGHSKTGVCNPTDLLYRLIAGCVQLRCAPDRDRMMNVAPVDYVSRAIVHLSRQKAALGETFHLVNPNSFHLSELVDWVRSMGYLIEQISYKNWQAEILNRAGYSPENALYPLVGLFSEKVSEAEIIKSAVLQFDCQNTLNRLSGTDIICPQADVNLFRTYLSFLSARDLI
ncbi:amino acid adenylation domain-containing protein [Kamptonema animale CS-326]|jgi:amino acid adenylation domain-containing protein/thioester reductase-like protein|uniref:non-ribosomal peptide synthetase family protein n=1 Tax=Kamptonema animale TaxID=92934 RepID=UPI00232B4944|nr:non-ribosomal peptide synthetase [Kamptonema animale]MDB9510444.1 amino acid adenylation domain-containing protein [Kamptonema animale CS-326]